MHIDRRVLCSRLRHHLVVYWWCGALWGGVGCGAVGLGWGLVRPAEVKRERAESERGGGSVCRVSSVGA